MLGRELFSHSIFMWYHTVPPTWYNDDHCRVFFIVKRATCVRACMVYNEKLFDVFMFVHVFFGLCNGKKKCRYLCIMYGWPVRNSI